MESFIEKFNESIKQLPGFVMWKREDLLFGGANLETAKLEGFSSIDNMIGISDYDLKSPSVEFADQFRELDTFAFQNKTKYKLLAIMKSADHSLYYLCAQSSLIYNEEKNLAGNIITGTFLPPTIISPLMHFFGENEMIKRQSCSIYKIDNTVDHLKLSSRELECLFYLLRGKTAKATAIILKISFRTVEQHISNLKLKFCCESKSQLIEAAMAKGYLYKIPSSVLKTTGVISIL